MKKSALIKFALVALILVGFFVPFFMNSGKASSDNSLENWIGSSVEVQLNLYVATRRNAFKTVKLDAVSEDGIFVRHGRTKSFINWDCLESITLK